MLTKRFATTLALGVAFSSPVLAQTEKATGYTPPPANKITVAGQSYSLDVKTLAYAQRLQDEKALREKISTALSPSKTGTNNSDAQIESKTQIASVLPLERSGPARSSQGRKIDLISIFGPKAGLLAEVRFPSGETKNLQTNDVVGQYRIIEISENGVTLVQTSTAQKRFLNVGSQL